MTPKSISKWLSMPFITFFFSEKTSAQTHLLFEYFSSTISSNELTRWNRHVYSLINSIRNWVFIHLNYRSTGKGYTMITSIHL
jgi:hypothetical protein